MHDHQFLTSCFGGTFFLPSFLSLNLEQFFPSSFFSKRSSERASDYCFSWLFYGAIIRGYGTVKVGPGVLEDEGVPNASASLLSKCSPTIFLFIASSRPLGLDHSTRYLHRHWALDRWCTFKHLFTWVEGQRLFFLVLSTFSYHRALGWLCFLTSWTSSAWRQCLDLVVTLILFSLLLCLVWALFEPRFVSFFSCDTRLRACNDMDLTF
jgi:hypothetical protein